MLEQFTVIGKLFPSFSGSFLPRDQSTNTSSGAARKITCPHYNKGIAKEAVVAQKVLIVAATTRKIKTVFFFVAPVFDAAGQNVEQTFIT